MKRAVRREVVWNRFKVNGHDCAIQYQLRTSTADCGATTYFHMGGKRIDLHSGSMDPRLKDLIPPAFASINVKPRHWWPFVQRAIGMGLLRAW